MSGTRHPHTSTVERVLTQDLEHPERSPRALGYRWPAEWEPLRAVWFAWPHERSDWPGKFEPIEWVFTEMLGRVARHARVALIVSPSARAHAEAVLTQTGIDLNALEILEAETERSWTRDTLPTWLIGPGASGAPRKLGAVKWRFNAWARYDNQGLDEAAGRRVAELRAHSLWLPEAGPGQRFVLEGGAIDGDGEGTLLTTDNCLLGTDFPRNPDLEKSRIESILSEHLCVQKVVWLPGGIAGDDTQGHVDDLARFVAPGRVVLAQEQNSADENYRPLQETREALQGVKDARGRSLEVIALPMPEPRAFDGQRLPASYANFLICNDLVLVPTFNDAADRVALGLFAELFPGRKVVGIYCGDLVLGLGAIHCSSHQEPLC
jgi:agmatine deiminase